MTALRSRTCICLQGAVMGSLWRMITGCLYPPVPGVKLEERFTAFAFRIFAFALSSPVS
jgi:hypothetical protein